MTSSSPTLIKINDSYFFFKYAHEITNLYMEVFSEPPYNESFDFDETLNDLRKYYAENILFALIENYDEENEEVIGFIKMKKFAKQTNIMKKLVLNAKSSIYLDDLGLKKSTRGKGYGKLLMEHIISNFGRDNTIFLRTGRKNNEGIIEFYKLFGFSLSPVTEKVENTRVGGEVDVDERFYMVRDKNSLISLEPITGARDFYPSDMLKRDWLFDQWHEISKAFAFKEYDAPILENASLWDSKTGSDDILSEMFAFTKGGKSLTLRPEMTPSVTRMIMNCRKNLVLPARWYSVPQCWRYESTARGRKREFYQWNADIFGAPPVQSEIEILSIIILFLQRLKLKDSDVVIRISDRRILQKFLEGQKIPEKDFVTIFNIIDKIEKLEKSEICEMFVERVGLAPDQIERILEFVQIKNIDDLEKNLPPSAKEVLDEITEIFSTLTMMGMEKWIKLDLTIIRGLSYYTGLIFEAYFKNSENKRAICGGGRYDNLMQKYGSEPLPAIGFGMGDVVIMDVLEELKLVPEMSHRIDYMVIPFDKSLTREAVDLSNKLRTYSNFSLQIETYVGKLRMKNALDYANRVGVEKVILLFPDEWKSGNIIVKQMIGENKTQETLNISSFLTSIKIMSCRLLKQPLPASHMISSPHSPIHSGCGFSGRGGAGYSESYGSAPAVEPDFDHMSDSE